MKFKCPKCKVELTEKNVKLKQYGGGYKTKCPYCKEKIQLSRSSKGFIRMANGELRKKK